MAKTEKTKADPVTPVNLFAYTEQAHGEHVPGYVSLNRCTDGSYWITARTSGGKETAGLCVPEDQLKAFAAAINAALA